jgi:dihydrofolate reductase
MREGLVDHIVIDLQPVAFGEGTPIFGDTIDMAQLKLLDSKPLNDNARRYVTRRKKHEAYSN